MHVKACSEWLVYEHAARKCQDVKGDFHQLHASAAIEAILDPGINSVQQFYGVVLENQVGSPTC